MVWQTTVSQTNMTRGMLTAVTDANNGTTVYEYDGNGNLMSVTDAPGNQTAYEYDALNNCIKEYRDAGEEKPVITLYQYELYTYNLNSALNYNEEGTGAFILNALKIAL